MYTWPWEARGVASQSVPATELYWLTLAVTGESAADLALPAELGWIPEAGNALCRELLNASNGPLTAAPAGAAVVSLVRECQQPGPYHQRHLTSLTNHLLISLARAAVAPQAPPRTAADDRVQTFLQTLPGQCHAGWTLEAMATACGLRRSQFATCIKRLTGDPPIQLLNRLRVARAQELLQAGASVPDVARQCGFANAQYLATVFRAFTGQSPSQWRRSERTRKAAGL